MPEASVSVERDISCDSITKIKRFFSNTTWLVAAQHSSLLSAAKKTTKKTERLWVASAFIITTLSEGEMTVAG